MHEADRCAIVALMATTKTIELRTDDSRAPLAARSSSARSASSPTPLSIYLPIVAAEAQRRHAHRRRRQHLHRLHGRRRLPQRRPLAPARRRGGAGAARALRAHRLHDRPVRGLRRARRAADRASRRSRGPAKAAFFNAGTEAVENAVKFARSYTKRPAVIAFEGALPRPHAALDDADLEDAPVQGRPRARSRPRSTACRSRTTTAGPTPTTALAALERAFVTQVAAESVAAIVIEPVQGEGGFVVAPPEFIAGRAARSATSTGSCSSSTRCRPASARTGKMFAIEHYGVEPDLITVAKSIAAGPAALGRDRQGGDHGRARATRRSAARTSATRSRRRPRSPCST